MGEKRRGTLRAFSQSRRSLRTFDQSTRLVRGAGLGTERSKRGRTGPTDNIPYEKAQPIDHLRYLRAVCRGAQRTGADEHQHPTANELRLRHIVQHGWRSRSVQQPIWLLGWQPVFDAKHVDDTYDLLVAAGNAVPEHGRELEPVPVSGFKLVQLASQHEFEPVPEHQLFAVDLPEHQLDADDVHLTFVWFLSEQQRNWHRLRFELDRDLRFGEHQPFVLVHSDDVFVDLSEYLVNGTEQRLR